jgi:hypothetical protein
MYALPRPVSSIRAVESRPEVGSTALRRVLASYLRSMRTAHGASIAEAKGVIRASTSKLSRMETAQSPLAQRDVEDLLAFYGVSEGERARIALLVKRAATPEWWRPYAEVVPEWLLPLAGLERDAQVVRGYETQFVPGLLQTPRYAAAVVRTSRRLDSPEQHEQAVRFRLERQDRVRQPGGPVLWTILDEGLLYRPIGGADVMREQLEHLLEAVGWPRVHVQIAPFASTAAVTPGGPVTYLRFGPDFLPDLVYVEQMTTGLYLDQQPDLDKYRAVLDRLGVLAATREDSRVMLEEAVKRYA